MSKSISILLVEDDLVDVKNVRRSFEQHKAANRLYVVSNGAEALEYLRHKRMFTDIATSPRPGIILLDLNMPIMNGIEFLQQVKQDENLRTIPVVVLTTSNEESDRLQSYELGIAGYIVKPVEFPNFLEVVKAFNAYWSMCELP